MVHKKIAELSVWIIMGSYKSNVIIRHESFGLLLWSYIYGCYFIPKDEYAQLFLSNYLDQLKAKSDIKCEFPETFKADIKCLGLNENIRQIWPKNNEFAPLDVYFDYTTVCNQRCKYCYNSSLQKNATLTGNQILHVIHELWKYGSMRLHLSGGEPTIFPEKLEKYLETACSLGMSVSINTNGTLLTPDICNILFNYETSSITVSVDSHIPKIHDSYRKGGEGSFFSAISGIKTAIKIAKTNNVNSKIKIKSVWWPETPLSNFVGLVELGETLGVDEVKFSCPEKSINHQIGYYRDHNYIEDYYVRIQYIADLKKKNQYRINIRNVSNPLVSFNSIGIKGKIGCIGGQELLAILPDGEIRPCLMNPNGLGNFFSDYNGEFLNLLKSQKLKKFLGTNNFNYLLTCNNCEYYLQCRGGSKVRVYTECKEYKACDPLCYKKYLSKKIKKNISRNNFKDCTLLNHFSQVHVVHSL